jgi:hypothetical protein
MPSAEKLMHDLPLLPLDAETTPVDPRPVWTLDTLYVYVTTLIAANDRRYMEHFSAQQASFTAAMRANQEALAITAESAEKWRQNSNEWRGAMDDRERNLMPRQLADQQHHALLGNIAELGERIDRAVTPLRQDLQLLREAQSQQRGSSTTAAAIFTGGLMVLGLVLSVLFKLWP